MLLGAFLFCFLCARVLRKLWWLVGRRLCSKVNFELHY